MRLALLYEDLEDDLKRAIGLNVFKKQQDPNHPSTQLSAQAVQPQRSGSQDTPMNPRHRKFFNAPLGPKGVGYGDQDDFESRRAKQNTLGEPQPELDYPVDKTPEDEEIERKARRVFGREVQAGQPPREF